MAIMLPGPDPIQFNAFFLLTGVTFAAFASGFGVCLFNLDTVDACVAVANQLGGSIQGYGRSPHRLGVRLAARRLNINCQHRIGSEITNVYLLKLPAIV